MAGRRGRDPCVDHAGGRAVVAADPRALDEARRDPADPRRDLDRLADGDLDERAHGHDLAAHGVGEADAVARAEGGLDRRRRERDRDRPGGGRRAGGPCRRGRGRGRRRRRGRRAQGRGRGPGRGRGRGPRAVLVQPRVALAEDPDDVRLAERPVVVGGRHDRPRLPDLDDDDRPDAVGERRARLPQPLDALGVAARPRLVDRRGTLEPVALAHERVDDVDLDERAAADVLDRLRGAHVGEEEVVVVENVRRPLGRQVRRAVRAHRRVEPEALLADQPLHVVGQDGHARILSHGHRPATANVSGE